MKQIVTIFLTMLFFTSTVYAKNLNTENVIAKMIESYGGEKKLLQLNSYKQTWSVEFMNSDKSGFDNRM